MCAIIATVDAGGRTGNVSMARTREVEGDSKFPGRRLIGRGLLEGKSSDHILGSIHCYLALLCVATSATPAAKVRLLIGRSYQRDDATMNHMIQATGRATVDARRGACHDTTAITFLAHRQRIALERKIR